MPKESEKLGIKMEMEKILVEKGKTLKETMRQIDLNGLGVAFIVNKDRKFLGMVTDGDIRRAILAGKSLELPIEEIMNQKPMVSHSNWSHETLKDQFRKKGFFKGYPTQATVKVPVLDNQRKVKGIVFVSKKEAEGKEVNVYSTLSEAKLVQSVLVIGGAGYLGSVLARKLLGNGYKVRVLDNLTYGDMGIKELYGKANFEFVKGDMRDLSAVTNAIKGMDAVIHLAAIVGDPASALSPQNTIEINYLAAKLVAEVCKFNQINRFLFASTCSVYGCSKSPEDFLNESSELNEISLYAKMKSQSEKALLEMQDGNFAPTILRMATLYGFSPRMRFDLVVNILTAKAVFDKEITIFGGSQWRPFLHVEDAAEVFIKCIKEPLEKVGGKVFNAGSNEQDFQIKEIGEKVKSIIPEAQLITTESGDERNYRVSFNKICKELGFQAKKNMEDGILEIKETIAKGIISDYKRKEYNNYRFLYEWRYKMEIRNAFKEIYELPEYRQPYDYPLREFPFLIDLEPTNYCNLDCLMCSRQIMKRGLGKMALGLFKRIADQAAANGAKGIRFMRFGEPLMNKDIFEMVSYAKQKGLLTHITTNGLLLNKEKIQAILDSGLDSIIFSLQGATKKEYKLMRNNKEYGLLEENIKKLAEKRKEQGLNKPFIQVTTTVLDETDEEIKQFYEKWKATADKADHWYTSLERLEGIERAKPLFKRQTVREKLEAREKNTGKNWRCNEVMVKLSIAWNGIVTGCCADFDNYMKAGNLEETSLKEIWHNKKMDSFRKILGQGQREKIPFCSKCTSKFFREKAEGK